MTAHHTIRLKTIHTRLPEGHDRIDTISRHILRERNVSPYQSDSR
jgi:hypothetical protein